MAKNRLTFDEFVTLWKSVVDEPYWRAFYEQPDSGVEAFEQAFAQYERASEAVDRSTQAMFILPWSDQSEEPAGGAARSQVALTVTRSRDFQRFVIFPRGMVIAHVVDDYGPEGAVAVETGRRYVVQADVVFLPGNPGPIFVDAVAEAPGYGYNLPRPGTLSRVVVAARGLTNGNAAIVVSGTNLLQCPDVPDVPASADRGQYVEIMNGANAGEVRRIVGPFGSSVTLDTDWTFEGVITGTFAVGETVTQATTGATAVVVAQGVDFLVATAAAGVFATGLAVTGGVSGATITPTLIPRSAWLVPDVGVYWRLLDWTADFGLVVTNAASPTGGRSAMLDELGDERGIGRTPGESDDEYRLRVWAVSDTVSPGAVLRAANRVLIHLGASACLREVGTEKLPGLFFDAGSSADAPQDPARNFAFDMDPDLRPEDRFKVLLGYETFRAFFLIGVPRLNLGEFGCAFDSTNASMKNAPDAPLPAGNFFDGYPWGNAAVYRAVYEAVRSVKAGGVGFDLYIEESGCV